MSIADNFSIFDDILERIGKEQEDLLAAEARVVAKVTCPDHDTSTPMRPQVRD
ncbi:hypothetical protein [Amycolatopsis sp. BJA-103]|uniref:hypothetical protein n=1 Tax=unclassified Amycolatopsis TaxID=2618356 RepID=UPI001304922A|nr:hypothetical protein [Amycolatopsis sp. BJA-103]